MARKLLSPDQVRHYFEFGYIAPIDILSEDEANHFRVQLEQAELKHPKQLAANNRNNAHLVFKFLDELAHHPSILDAVEDLIGPNILLSNSVLFIKEPSSKAYVSWHQDATYMELFPHHFVTPWLALSHSNEHTGCMAFVPGSHRNAIEKHTDTYAPNNILTRGQVINDVDETKAVDIVLRPGQMSLHHPLLVHRSKPNYSKQRRIGFALQSYLPPFVQQMYGQISPLLVRGEDESEAYTLSSRPNADLQPENIKLRDKVNQNLADILYKGAAKRRNL